MTRDAVSPEAEGKDSTAFFGPSEPNWAQQVQARRLAGVLNVCCLLSRVTFVSDNDVADNSNFFHSFVETKSEAGLYQRLKRFADMGFVRILLRDESFRIHSTVPIGSFTDIYDAWLQQDPTNAWTLQDFGADRRLYFRDVDSWAQGKAVVRYPYKDVKRLFAQIVRQQFGDSTTDYQAAMYSLPAHLNDEYEALINRDWFSLTDVNTLLQDWKLPANHPALLYHGMLNQVAYSSFHGDSLVGVDSDVFSLGSPTELRDESRSRPLSGASLNEILERAEAVLDGPSLAILSVLRPEEIAALRLKGESYFSLIELSQDPIYSGGLPEDFAPRFIRAAVLYWQEICEYIRASYSPLVEKPTKLAMFLGFDPTINLLPARAVSIAVDAGVKTAEVLLPPAAKAIQLAPQALGLLQLRLLFLAPTEELIRIREVMPRSSWFRRGGQLH